MFRIIIALTISLSIAYGAIIPSNALTPQLDGRIVGGSVASIDSFPWQVSLQRNGFHSCGGAIYNEHIVLTAAHCMQSAHLKSLTIRAGSSHWNSGGVVVPVANFSCHVNYDAANMLNDIAVIRLKTPLPLGNSMQSIDLAASTPADGAIAVVTGWGTTFYGSISLPTQLMNISVQIIGRNKCASSDYGYGPGIKPTMICAYAQGKDACQGDSGGPMVSNGVLVGIVSWGYGCAYPKFPGVYADVASLHDWVVETAKTI